MTRIFLSFKKGKTEAFYDLLHKSIDPDEDFSLFEVNLKHRLKKVSNLFTPGFIERELSQPDFAIVLLSDIYLQDKWLLSELYALYVLEQQKKRDFIIPVLYSNIKTEEIPIYFKENPNRLLDIREMTDEEGANKLSSHLLNMIKDDKRIFIGHGRSLIWMVFKEFIINLGLGYDEFNRESTAGNQITQVLSTKLLNTNFAFIIMTGEDEHDDQTLHARENVVHEAGLFQGKMGFERAIILLENGCKEFSNIHGVIHIPFPKGNIKACFEDVRDVLKREKIIL